MHRTLPIKLSDIIKPIMIKKQESIPVGCVPTAAEDSTSGQGGYTLLLDNLPPGRDLVPRIRYPLKGT